MAEQTVVSQSQVLTAQPSPGPSSRPSTRWKKRNYLQGLRQTHRIRRASNDHPRGRA
jgi:hypothetical protein